MVSPALRRWFVVHFLADVAFALPLMVAPRWFLETLGWQMVDPVTARLVAAALIGVGVESFLGRHQGPEAYRGMLRLKLLWSASASLGLLWSALEGGPPMVWGFLAVFVAFHLLWLYWYRQIGAIRHPLHHA